MQEERNYTVYEHVFPNGKRYIGITSMKPEQRWGVGGRGYRRKIKGKYTQPLMAQATLKYNWDTEIEHNILAEGLTKEEAEQMEVELIAKYKSNDPEFGYNIENGGCANKVSEATKKKLSESKKGDKNPNYGKPLSDETKRKLSEVKTAEGNPFYGKHHTEETKQILREKNSKKVICIETGEIFDSITIASQCTGVDRSDISKVCKGKKKAAGGYRWQEVA